MSEFQQKAPFDPVLSDMLIKNLFYYFEKRGFRVVAGHIVPQIVDNTGGEYASEDDLNTLEEIQEAGPEFVRAFLNFTMKLLMEH